MSIFIVVRHTRADEETGRLELIGSAVVGRNAALAAALLVAGRRQPRPRRAHHRWPDALGLPAAGSIALALAIAGSGLVFTAVAAVCAQVAGTARAARGLALAVIGGDLPAAGGRRLVGTARPALAQLAVADRVGGADQVVRRDQVVGAGAAGRPRGDRGGGRSRPRRPPGLRRWHARRSGRAPRAAAASLRSPFALAWRLQLGRPRRVGDRSADLRPHSRLGGQGHRRAARQQPDQEHHRPPRRPSRPSPTPTSPRSWVSTA